MDDTDGAAVFDGDGSFGSQTALAEVEGGQMGFAQPGGADHGRFADASPAAIGQFRVELESRIPHLAAGIGIRGVAAELKDQGGNASGAAADVQCSGAGSLWRTWRRGW